MCDFSVGDPDANDIAYSVYSFDVLTFAHSALQKARRLAVMVHDSLKQAETAAHREGGPCPMVSMSLSMY